MMHIAVSGSKYGMSEAQVFMFGMLLGKLLQEDSEITIHHGDCIGVDSAVASLTEAHNIPVIVHPPVNDRYKGYNETRPNVVAVREPKDYLDRNHDMVDECFMHVAMPNTTKEQLRSGTWATVRYARKKGKPVAVIYPNGYVENH